MVTGSTMPGVAPGAAVILWRFAGTAEFLAPNDSGRMHRLSMRYLAVLRRLVREWLLQRGTRDRMARGARAEWPRLTRSCPSRPTAFGNPVSGTRPRDSLLGKLHLAQERPETGVLGHVLE